jgi:high frequency lysogenization protein
MEHTIRERTLALAGIFQAVALVKQIARAERRDKDAIEASIRSILKIDAPSVDDIYGGVSGLELGLGILKKQLGKGANSRDVEITQYAVTILHLERKLNKRPALMTTIREGIEHARSQVEYFSAIHDTVIASLAETYLNTVSTLPPRVIVKGDPSTLTDKANTELIRALLLAGIRACVLWRQCGGNRFNLLLNRGAIVAICENLLTGRGSP